MLECAGGEVKCIDEVQGKPADKAGDMNAAGACRREDFFRQVHILCPVMLPISIANPLPIN